MGISALILAFVLPTFAADPSQTVAALEQSADERYRRGDYREAERLQKQVLQLWKDAARTQPVDLSKPYYRLAGIYLAQGKLTAAERYAEAASGHQDRSRASSADRARVLNLAAQIRFQQRRYREAAELQEKVVRLMEQEDRSTGLARMLNDLAMIHAATGELRLARPLLERAVELHRRSAGQPDDGFGETLGNLALVCARQGDLSQAEASYRQAVDLMERTRGREHPHLGLLLSEYSAVLRKNGRKAEARTIDRRAKAILESARFPGHDTVDAGAFRKRQP
ncbi:MAG: tetratricopeptide repeat protein [Bryobacterales bacterium]|nr:tetratricopeptide repeat protein [Bryobacterales bacterium]